jgi:hypothetical protein
MKIGDVVKPIANTNNHNYAIGRKHTIIAAYNNGAPNNGIYYWLLRDDTNGIQGQSYISENDLALYSITKKEVENKIKDMEIEIHKNRKMLEYLSEENKEEVNVTEFFAWYIVQIMESEDPKKKEKISKLLNSVTNNINLDILLQH